MAFALPGAPAERADAPVVCHDLELHEIPLGSSRSFLDFDGVVLFAGVFERVVSDNPWRDDPRMILRAPSELDLRERQFLTAIQENRMVVFLVPSVPRMVGYSEVPDDVDLFRRVLAKFGIRWQPLSSPMAYTEARVSEFKDFVQKYGTAYVQYFWEDQDPPVLHALCGRHDAVYGLSVVDKVFLLPCPYPQTHDQALAMAVDAVRGAREYRERRKKELPEWIAEYKFTKEAELAAKASALRGQLLEIDTQMDSYRHHKGVLCLRSDPLVETVAGILRHFLGIDLVTDDKCIEDAVLRDPDGNTLAVFEVKGVNASFSRDNVNQVDSHRERLGLPSTTPGILIMNTMMAATSLAGKEQAPHADIIKKAVDDNVLLFRTLDLLRCADAVERGVLGADKFRQILLTSAGWLTFRNEKIEIITQ